MRRSPAILLVLAIAVGHAQIEPPSWFQFWSWLGSLNSGDVVKHGQFLKEHATQDARMRHPFSHEAIAEMELRDRVGGGFRMHRMVSWSETEVHAILLGKDQKTWVEALLRITTEQFNRITLIELRQVATQHADVENPAGDPPTASQLSLPTEFTQSPIPLRAPELLTPEEGAVFDHFPRSTTVSWTAVPGATGYWLEWDFKERDGWHSVLYNVSVPPIEVEGTSYTFEFVGAQMGRWRVRAFDEWGVTGMESEWRWFRYIQ